MSALQDIAIGTVVFLILSPIAVKQYNKNKENKEESKDSEGCGCGCSGGCADKYEKNAESFNAMITKIPKEVIRNRDNQQKPKRKCRGWRRALGICKDEEEEAKKQKREEETKPEGASMKVIRRHKKNNNCYAYNIERADGSDFWKVLTYSPKGRNQRDRDNLIIAAKGGKIFKTSQEVDDWCKSRQRGRRRQEEDAPTSEVPVPVATATVNDSGGESSQHRTTKIGECSPQCNFMLEMVHEGIELTSKGKSIERTIAKAYLPDHPDCYQRALMGFFGGKGCEQGIFWRKLPNGNPKAAREMKETCCGDRSGSGDLGAESFSAFDPVNDFLPRYRYPADSAWSPAYNPAAPYRQLDEQAIATYPCHHDEGTRVSGE